MWELARDKRNIVQNDCILIVVEVSCIQCIVNFILELCELIMY